MGGTLPSITLEPRMTDLGDHGFNFLKSFCFKFMYLKSNFSSVKTNKKDSVICEGPSLTTLRASDDRPRRPWLQLLDNDLNSLAPFRPRNEAEQTQRGEILILIHILGCVKEAIKESIFAPYWPQSCKFDVVELD
jgi:hypothetical protein